MEPASLSHPCTSVIARLCRSNLVFTDEATLLQPRLPLVGTGAENKKTEGGENVVLWVSQHPPLPSQERELKRLYGPDTRVVHSREGNAQAVAREFRSGGYRDLVAVVPLATLDYLCREGLKPLWAEMVETPQEGRKPDLDFRGKRLWFTGFKRVGGVTLELAPAQPESRTRILRATRHPASREELADIRRLFGERVEVVEDDRPFRDGREVLDWAARAGADDLLVVAPYSVMDQIVQSGRKPLWARIVGGRFDSLHRVQGIRIDFEGV